MATFGAYDSGLACQNPSCKSHGKPHPNCQCYGEGLADGGEVKSFCSEDRTHDPSCEYYAEGGEVPNHDPHGASHFIIQHGLHGLLKLTGKPDLETYEKGAKKGKKTMESAIEALFGKGEVPSGADEKAKKTITDWIEKGGINKEILEEQHKQNTSPAMFSKGGEVQAADEHGVLASENPLASIHSAQNVILQGNKGNMSNYLNNLKADPHTPRLAFDDPPDQKQKKKSFDRAVELAANPLGILDKIKKGTVEPEHVKHFSGLHPQINDTLQKNLTSRIVKAQLDGEKPNSTVRQGLSLLMGTPLSGELVPQNIQAAQAVFAPKPMPPSQPSQGPKQKKSGSKAALSKSDQAFLTGNQSLIARSQKD